ncbi:type III pantothenate kinase [Blastopirellula marina]|uniref:Type III pantothenate kinase n=1 Tax=Blastopirellula marina TaxID=124 RepID=A0A2S8GK66_9BACT|nr:type III pantothenate kinase [Blastopirellula marina]PQO44833.1 hypothetical protein C5Y93_17210 [Blastopirellula marina]
MRPESFVAVDIGNSRVHLARFENFRAEEVTAPISTYSYTTSSIDIPGLREWIGKSELPWFAVSVHRPALASLEVFSKSESGIKSFTTLDHSRLPIEVTLAEPAKVGADRLAAAVAANQMRANGRPAIVVDAGTAITIDVLSADGKFIGGAILPGMRTSAKALAAQTDALPQIEVDLANQPPAVGTNTIEAMQSGLFWGSVGAVRETIRRITDQLSSDQPPQVFFSGGDVNYLAPWIDLEIETIDHLVLRGVGLAAQHHAA